MIQTNNLTKRFGDFTAVDQLTFAIQAGEVVGYLGPNGSGKTTTMRMLLGLILPTEGTATVLGYDIRQDSDAIRAEVGYMSQKFSLYHDLTVNENLHFYAGVYGINNENQIQACLDRVGLEKQKNILVSNLSTGWKQRLALATAIVHHPRLLFLDEPTSGVDPTARRAFWDLIYELVAEGITALVTTHYMDEAEYCGRVGIMREGKLLALDTPSNLKISTLPGKAYDLRAQPILDTLQVLEQSQHVLRSGLVGDHLRVILSSEVKPETIVEELKNHSVNNAEIEQVEPTLEDVFLSLAAQ